MQNANLTITQSGTNQHDYQTVHPDYTGIYAFCGTIFILAIILYCLIFKISEKWRIDNYKLKLEEIKSGIASFKELSKNLKTVEILLKRIIGNGTNNICNDK